MTSRRSNLLRLLFFSCCSLWGFLVGVATTVLANGESRALSIWLWPGVLISMAGAAVIAASYREGRRRWRP